MFDTVPQLRCGEHSLALDRPLLMGIVNLTPDSFSDGGAFDSVDAAVAHALRLVEEGADLLDLGGESTRPGAEPVAEQAELDRVMPVLEQLVKKVSVPISVDTSKAGVMRAALGAGASLINDVCALQGEGALEAVAASNAAVCLMHMQGEPRSMQSAPDYDDVVADVHRFLAQRIFSCEMSGIGKPRIIVDPGFGFGKTVEHNYRLLRQLARFADLGVPLLAGLSRKSMIGAVTTQTVEQRVFGSVAAALIAAQNGARIVRVHDVAATRDALAVWQAVQAQPGLAAAPAKPAMPRWPDDD